MIEYEDTPGGRREVYAAVVEKRWSNLLQSILCVVTVFLFPMLKLIPQAVLAGTFLYMGASGYERLGSVPDPAASNVLNH